MNNRSILPNTVKRYIGITTAVAAIFSLSACSSLDSILENKVDYRSGSDNLNRNPLEVPPDLTRPGANNTGQYNAPGAATYTDVATTRNILSSQSNVVLPEGNSSAKLVQQGNERWLVVSAPPEKVWPQIREFWLNQGFALELDNPNIGIMETDWLENRAKLPKDWVRKIIGKVIDNVMSTGEMDKFRTRIERGPNNTTEIFISHRGMVEVFKNTGEAQGRASNEMPADTIWTPRQSDPELETEMLRLMLVQLGVREEVAKTTVANPEVAASTTSLIDFEGGKALLLSDTFDRAWRRVGLALDRVGYVVVDRNRAEGIYYVRRAAEDIAKEEKPGFFASLAFWRSQDKQKNADASNLNAQPEFEVQLREQDGKTLVHLVPKGEASAKVDVSAVLNRLMTELK